MLPSKAPMSKRWSIALVLACVGCVAEDADEVPGGSTGSEATEGESDGGEPGFGAIPLDPQTFALQYAAQLCAAFYECECEEERFSDIEGCIAALQASVEDVNARSSAAGLTFDAGCAARTLTYYADAGCTSYFDFVAAPQNRDCEAACRVWHGDVPAGGACERYPELDLCAAGTDCGPSRTCTPFCDLLVGEGGACEGASVCAWGLHCGPDIVCEASPGEGEPCAVTRFGDPVCQHELGCVDGICRERLPGGEPCTADGGCQSDECLLGVCLPSPPRICSVAS